MSTMYEKNKLFFIILIICVIGFLAWYFSQILICIIIAGIISIIGYPLVGLFDRIHFKKIKFPPYQQAEDVAIITDIIENANTLFLSNFGWYGYRYREESKSKTKLTQEKIIQALKCYLITYDYAGNFKSILPERINFYMSIYWPFIAINNHTDKYLKKEFFQKKYHRKISFYQFIKLSKSSILQNKHKVFLLMVLGPSITKFMMNIFLNRKNN